MTTGAAVTRRHAQPDVRALMADLVARCRAEGWTRLYWHTQAGNAVARRLYDSYARPDDMLRYRMLLPTAYSGA